MAVRDKSQLSAIPANHRWANEPGHYKYPYHVVDGELKKIVSLIVHNFTVGDVDDPELYAAMPIAEWQDSEQGQWVMRNAIEAPVYFQRMSYRTLGWVYAIKAKFWAKDATFFILKWGDSVDKDQY